MSSCAAAAREIVLRLVGDIDADGVDAGPLKLLCFTEPLCMLITNLAYVRGYGSRIGVILFRD